MSGRGKSGKGLGKSGVKRNRKVLRDNIQGITKHDIRRLMRRGGVKRISGLMYAEVRTVLTVVLGNILKDAITFTETARRKTVTAADVEFALWANGHKTVYGGLSKTLKSSKKAGGRSSKGKGKGKGRAGSKRPPSASKRSPSHNNYNRSSPGKSSPNGRSSPYGTPGSERRNSPPVQRKGGRR